MANKEKIIRNKARAFQQKLGNVEPYQPEHVRMSREAIPWNPGQQEVDEQIAAPSRVATKPIALGGGSSRGVAPGMRGRAPGQVRVVSGNPEQAWLQPEAVAQQNLQALADEEQNINSAQYRYDDVPSPPSARFVERNPQNYVVSDESGEQEFSFSDLMNNEYCIVVRGDILYISTSRQEIEDVIETMLFEHQTVTHEEVIVLQRLKLKVGVSVDR